MSYSIYGQESVVDSMKVEARDVEDEEEIIISDLDEMPEFPGGHLELAKYLQNNILYPDSAMKYNTQGKVYVRFQVKKDGSIDCVVVLKGIGYGCDVEAIRIIKKMPRWKPGLRDGEPVKVLYTLPINFLLN